MHDRSHQARFISPPPPSAQAPSRLGKLFDAAFDAGLWFGASAGVFAVLFLLFA